jgi:hypothetical protein
LERKVIAKYENDEGKQKGRKQKYDPEGNIVFQEQTRYPGQK